MTVVALEATAGCRQITWVKTSTAEPEMYQSEIYKDKITKKVNLIKRIDGNIEKLELPA